LPPRSDNKVAKLLLTRGSSMCKGNSSKTTVRRWLALATQSSSGRPKEHIPKQ
jgi:hypothetical protein